MPKVKSYKRKDGTRVKAHTKKKGWAIYSTDRRTPILVDGNLPKKKAIEQALTKVKKRGSNKVDKVRRLTDSEQRLADKGKWVKGHNIDKERKNLRGVGPKPLGFEFARSAKIKSFIRAGRRVKSYLRKIPRELKVGNKVKLGSKWYGVQNKTPEYRQLLKLQRKTKGKVLLNDLIDNEPLKIKDRNLSTYKDNLEDTVIHATTQENLNKILKSRIVQPSKSGLYGPGVYTTTKADETPFGEIGILLPDQSEFKNIKDKGWKVSKERIRVSKKEDLILNSPSKLIEYSPQTSSGRKNIKIRFSNTNPNLLIEFKLAESLIKVGAHRRAGKWVKGFKRTQLLKKGDIKGIAKDVTKDAAISKGVNDARSVLKAYGQTTDNKIVGKFINKGDLPTRKETANIVSKLKPKAANPIKAVKKGFERERLFLDSISKMAGRKVTKGEIIAAGTKKAANTFKDTVKQAVDDPKAFIESELAETAIVNIVGGVGGGKVGGVLLGPPGAVLGDLAGARTARRGLTDVKAAINSYQQRHSLPKLEPEFGVNSRLQRFGQIMDDIKQRSAAEIKERGTQGIADDIGGWAAGNTVASVISNVPFVGVAPGMMGSIYAQSIEKRMRERGEDLLTAAQKTLASNVKAGDKREEELRKRARELWTSLV